MTKITQIDRAATKAIADRAEERLEELAQELGLNVRYAGGSFSASNAVIKFEFAVVGENGQAATREAEAFKQLAFTLGLQPDDLGRRFSNITGEVFEIVGLKPKSPRFPLLGKRVRDGKVFKFVPKAVVNNLEARS
jgi:hypothetical protein